MEKDINLLELKKLIGEDKLKLLLEYLRKQRTTIPLERKLI